MANRRRWITWGFVLLVVLVTALVAAVFLFPRGIGLPVTFQISPGEVTLCPGQGRQFRIVHAGGAARGITWETTGGIIGPEGFYVAPDAPGDYQLSAQNPQTGYRASAAVHVIQCAAETPPATPILPTFTSPPVTASPTPPPPTSTPASTQTPAPTASSTPAVPLDASGDLISSDTLEPVVGAPPGSDIRTACFDEERHLVQEIPQELAAEVSDWDTAGNLIFWITFHEPIPELPDTKITWLFAMDTDGDTATGRPIGDGLVNPDIGVEVTVGVQLDPALGIEFEPYMFVWNAQTGNSESRAEGIEARLCTTRDAVAVRVSLDVLASLVRELSQTEPQWDRMTGRAAVLVVTGEGTAVDFFPERP